MDWKSDELCYRNRVVCPMHSKPKHGKDICSKERLYSWGSQVRRQETVSELPSWR